jgi:hypothetical protein
MNWKRKEGTADGSKDHLLPQDIPQRLQAEFLFYDSGAKRHLKRYQRFKTMQIIAGSAIPVASLVVPDREVRGVTAALGALVAAIESYLQFRQYQQNWIRWRSTAEALKREAFLYFEKAGPYRSANDPKVLLAETVEEIVGNEQQSWRAHQQKSGASPAASAS